MKNFSIGKKLGLGFGTLVVLLAAAGLVGLDGIRTMAGALHVVGDREAPVVEAANEMKLSLMVARDSMAEYSGATAVLATDDEAALEGIIARYQKTVGEFDVFVGGILDGGQLGNGLTIVKTEHAELAALVREADQVRKEVFQPAATEMMEAGKVLLEMPRRRLPGRSSRRTWRRPTTSNRCR
jgi:methyl-accepting chemotaxis protein